MIRVKIAESDEQIAECFPVMHQLRPHVTEDVFLAKVRRQQQAGYALAYAEDDGRVVSVAGFRLLENMASGRLLYVDDLVTLDGERSKGYGKVIFEWLVDRARAQGCDTFELDSGVQRFDAHRFYFANRMIISSHHFRLEL